MKKNISKTKRLKLKISEVIFHIKSSYNNTIVTVSDKKGKTIVWNSAGTIGFKGTKKSTPYAAKLAVERCLEVIKTCGIKSIIIFTNGIGPGRMSSIKTLKETEYEIRKIYDFTSVPFNGCRAKKERKK